MRKEIYLDICQLKKLTTSSCCNKNFKVEFSTLKNYKEYLIKLQDEIESKREKRNKNQTDYCDTTAYSRFVAEKERMYKGAILTNTNNGVLVRNDKNLS